MKKKFQWSPSKLADYKNCPRQFYEKHIAKSVKFVQTEALKWGNAVHKALEVGVKHKKAMPENMAAYQPVVDSLNKLDGLIYTERKIAVDEDLNIVGWFDPSVWGRVIVDFTCVMDRDGYALVIDYKTGKVPAKKYYDPTQITISALVPFIHHPELGRVVSRYMYVSHLNEGHDSVTVNSDEQERYWDQIRARVRHINEDDNFLPKPCGLCHGWCPVATCEFNKSAKQRWASPRDIIYCDEKGQRAFISACAANCANKCDTYRKATGDK